MLGVAHNIVAMNAQRQYSINTNSKKKSSEKLSSGYKINRAADDAAGLTISEKMRSQIRGLAQGVNNCYDGVSICQIGDGALHEVQDMLHRLTELSVKSANGTNTQADRDAIQKEINEILKEIDRVGESTKFNTIPIFKGQDIYAYNSDGSVISNSDIPFSDIQLSDVILADYAPFTSTSDGKTLNLNASVVNPNSGAHGAPYSLIYGNGNTSDSSVIINYTDASNSMQTKQIMLSEFNISNYSESAITNPNGSPSPVWRRTFTYTDNDNGIDIAINQSIWTSEDADGSKNYHLQYDTYNNGTTRVSGTFVFNMDTAYNSNDHQEEYWINSNRIDSAVMSNSDRGQCTVFDTSGIDPNNILSTNVNNGVSIISTNNALPFSQNFSASGASHIILGRWPDQLEHMNNLSENVLNNRLNNSILGRDKAITALFENAFVTDNSASVHTISMTYGIRAVERDPNLSGISISRDDSPVILQHKNRKDLWIQAGADNGSGFDIYFDEMNTNVLGLYGLDVSTENNAKTAIKRIENALENVSANRSQIGAQQNRLEATIRNEDNVVENTQAAESRIRDTDMADEMVNFTRHNILTQVGEAMMTQANQSNQGVLSILGS